MDYTFKMESVLIAITTVLCSTLVLNLIYKLRLALPWRVNCWFCNQNFWVKFDIRNSWVCAKCEQYNGFTKDGDYNKPITSCLSNDYTIKSPKVFQRSPPKNGLCKMCNVNQQLKVAQLANFVPMHERNFDDEIENYKMQLEKAYKLCSPCRKVLQKKLHKEKEILLGSKVQETRSPGKMKHRQTKQSSLLQSFVNKASIVIAGVLVLLVSIECYKKSDKLPSSLANIKDILTGLLDRLITIMKMKLFLTFPILENYSFDFMNNELLDIQFPMSKIGPLDQANEMTQKALGGLVCLIQIIGHIWNVNKLKNTVLIDILWSVFVVMSVADKHVTTEPIYNSLVKLTSLFAVLLVYKNMDQTRTDRTPARIPTSRIKNLRNGTLTSFLDDDSDILMETDDDVSLSKFGLHNFTDSSTDTVSPLSASMLNGRSFTPRIGDGIWSKPKLNSTFCVNSVLSKSPSSISDTMFAKPSFNSFQSLTKDDSDSDLDESISSLCISSPKKSTQKSNSIFSLRKFNATPSFVAPAPMKSARPLISPSKLGHSTSWVAGGYWGSEGERPIFSVNGSRSSSQSSGFESQASSANQLTAASQPPSREESVCGDPAAGSLLDRFQQGSYSNYQSPASFARVNSPVFPQMQYNGHVHIPQARFAAQPSSPASVFSQPQYQHNGLLKPGGSGLINLAQLSAYGSR